MTARRFLLTLLLALYGVPAAAQATDQDASTSQLATALTTMYRTCLFDVGGPFGSAISLTSDVLAPGISAFVESNLASLPLAPPNLDLATEDGQLVTTVAGFAPVFTESSATVGGGNFIVGSSFSYANLSKIRGDDISDIRFIFVQDGGADRIEARMPLEVSASVLTFYGTYGITDALDVGFALPVVRLTMEQNPTTFNILDNTNTGVTYGGNLTALYNFVDEVTIGGNPNADLAASNVEESVTYLSTVALRAKYRFPLTSDVGQLAALLDLRIPTTGDDSVLGEGNLGLRLMLIGEIARRSGFKPYLNVGGQYWGDPNVSSAQFAAGFNQRLSTQLFFSFDLLGTLALEETPFLDQIDADVVPGTNGLLASDIRAIDRDHALNTAISLQFVFSPGFHAYGSAMFSLLDAGVQATIIPTVGAAIHL
jgi:hypothetical protein